MLLSALVVAVLLSTEAAPPAGTEACDITDNRCRAAEFERRAAAAADPKTRGLLLFTAFKSYLVHFDAVGRKRDLCAARRAFDAALAVSASAGTLSANLADARAKLVARERRHGGRCDKRVKRASTGGPTPPPLLVATTSPAADVVAEEKREASPPVEELMAPLASRPVVAAVVPRREVVPVVPSHEPASRASRSGRGLVIAGGATLAVGVGLTTAAALTGRRMSATRQEIVALGERVDGYATTQQAAQDDALRGDYRMRERQTAALAITGGATVIVAVVLASVGGRRMARVASRTALLPAPGGLVFHARF